MKAHIQLLVVLFVGIFQLLQFREALAVNTDTQYTPAEKEGLKKFKEAAASIFYKDYQQMDSYLIHFLRKKNLNVNEAAKLLKENFKWRKANKVDSILQEKNMIEMEKKFPTTTDGVDKEGRPTLSYNVNNWDIRRFILAGRSAEFNRYTIYFMEKISRKVYQLENAGHDVSQLNVLIDLSGFNPREHGCLPCLQGLSEFISLAESKYPNAVNQVIMINAPRSFETIIKITKGLLPREVQRLINVFGYDKSEWRAHIEKHFDDDQISTAFGGTRPKRRAK